MTFKSVIIFLVFPGPPLFDLKSLTQELTVAFLLLVTIFFLDKSLVKKEIYAISSSIIQYGIRVSRDGLQNYKRGHIYLIILGFQHVPSHAGLILFLQPNT